MKRYNLIVAMAAAVGWLCPPTLPLADHQPNRSRGVSSEEFSVIVPVLDVEPLVRIVQVTTPQEVCWEEPVHHAGYRGRNLTLLRYWAALSVGLSETSSAADVGRPL